jgi:preprotein translocase subunit SecG
MFAYYLVTILIFVVCLLLILIVLVQNSKGGGLTSSFSSSNQVLGVKKTADFLEKATWTLSVALLVLTLSTIFFIPSSNTSVEQKSTYEYMQENQDAAPVEFGITNDDPNLQSEPQGGQALPQGEEETPAQPE